MRNRVLGVVLGLFTGCVTVGMPVATSTQLERAVQATPGVTAEQVMEGRSLYVRRCGNCHQLIEPKLREPDEWPAEVDRMAQRANLTPEQRQRVVLYLQTVAKP